MNSIIESLTGMNKMTDQVIATDFLISAKSGIINYSIALTEAASPKVRAALRRQLYDALLTHETISNYMIKKGYYHPHNLDEQYKVDLNTTNTTLNLVSK